MSAIALTAIALAIPTGGPADGTLFVSGYTPDAVFRYDAVPGEFLGTLDASGGIDGPLGLTRGPDGRVYVASELTDSVLRFEPAGAFVDVFVAAGSEGLTEPASLVFGPDRNDDGREDLYVSSFDGDSVLVFGGTDGAFIETFVTARSGGLNGPDAGMTFGPDGHLYVPSFWSNQVLRYDGATGDFVDVFVPSGRGGLQRPRTIVFRESDGNMLVTCESTDRVVLYDGTTGELIRVLVTGINGPTGLVVDSAGWMYVAGIEDAVVYRYDETGGQREEVVSPGEGGLATPTFLLLLEACRADLDGDGVVAFGDVLAILAAWGPCDGCPEDLDGDGVVAFGDVLVVLGAWGGCP